MAAPVSHAIVDTFGGAISGARLTVRDSAAAVIRIATTDASGGFSFTDLRSGSYNVQVERDLFEPAQVSVDLTEGVFLPPGE